MEWVEMRVRRRKTSNTEIRITDPGSAVFSAQKSQNDMNLSLFPTQKKTQEEGEEKKQDEKGTGVEG